MCSVTGAEFRNARAAVVVGWSFWRLCCFAVDFDLDWGKLFCWGRFLEPCAAKGLRLLELLVRRANFLAGLSRCLRLAWFGGGNMVLARASDVAHNSVWFVLGLWRTGLMLRARYVLLGPGHNCFARQCIVVATVDGDDIFACHFSVDSPERVFFAIKIILLLILRINAMTCNPFHVGSSVG